MVYNKINSLEDQFNQSGEIALATYTTFDDPSTQTPPMGVVFPQDFARDGEENGTAGMPAGSMCTNLHRQSKLNMKFNRSKNEHAQH